MNGTFAAIVGAIQTTTPVEAGNVTGNQALEFCQSKAEVQQSFCIGYVLGILEGSQYGAFKATVLNLDAQEIPLPSQEQTQAFVNLSVGFCAPKEATTSQFIDVAVNYLEDHPEARHNTAREQILLSWAEAFPCE